MAERTIETNLKLTGEKEFNQQMKALNNGLKTTKSYMAALSAEFDGNADSVEALSEKQKLLQSSMEQHKNKVSALSNQYEAAKEALGENSALTQKYEQDLNYARVELAKAEKAVKKNADALRAAEKAVEDNAKATEESERANKKYIPVTKRMADAVDEAKKEIEDFKSEIKDAAYHTPVLGEAMDVAKASAKALGKAVDASGKALKGMGNVAGATAKGTLKVAGGAAKGIGAISAASVAGVAALGVGAVAILTKMASFAKEAADAAKAAKEAGEPLTDDQKKWLAFSEQLDAVEASVETAKTALGNVLLPALSELAGKGSSFLSAFAQDMEMAGEDTKTQGRVIAKYITRLVKDLIAELPEFVELGKELIGGIGEGLSRSGPELFDQIWAMTMDILNFVLDYAPEFAMAAIALVEKMVQALTEDGGPELIQSAVDMVSAIILGLAQAAPDLIPAAVKLVGQLLIALVAAAPDLILAGLELVYGVIQGIFNSFDDIKNAVSELIKTAKEAFSEKGDEFSKIGSEILEYLEEGFLKGWEAFTTWITGTELWKTLFGDKNINVNFNEGGDGNPGEDGSAFGGLRYVPFDNYMARLHQGEMVLTRAEADAYRNNRGHGGQKIINLNFTATTITEADVNMVVDIVNRKLGEAM